MDITNYQLKFQFMSNMIDGILVLAMLLSLFKASLETELKYGFTSMTPPCNIHHSVYETKSDTSVIKCAYSCNSNLFGMCGRYVWNQDLKTCKLHSATVYTGTTPTEMVTDWGWVIYSQMKPECVAVGYDYDPETNTCLKLMTIAGTTWKAARDICQNDGGDLISVTTDQKWDFVKNYIQCTGSLWIGLQGTQWLSGDIYIPTVKITAQLNNHDSAYQSDPEQNCGLLYPGFGVPLQDESCNIRPKSAFLCEVIIS